MSKIYTCDHCGNTGNCYTGSCTLNGLEISKVNFHRIQGGRTELLFWCKECIKRDDILLHKKEVKFILLDHMQGPVVWSVPEDITKIKSIPKVSKKLAISEKNAILIIEGVLGETKTTMQAMDVTEENFVVCGYEYRKNEYYAQIYTETGDELDGYSGCSVSTAAKTFIRFVGPKKAIGAAIEVILPSIQKN
jgi:hypothetical protein